MPQTSQKLIFTVSTNPAISGTLPQKEVWQKAPCSLHSDRENTKRTRSSPVQRDETAHPKSDVRLSRVIRHLPKQTCAALLLKTRCPPSVIQVPALFATKLDSHTSKYFEIPRDHLKKEEVTAIQPSNARTDRKHSGLLATMVSWRPTTGHQPVSSASEMEASGEFH